MNIPEKDQNCLNCRFLATNRDSETCGGRKCCNWSGEYTTNYFEPDEDYIRTELAKCNNCAHYNSQSMCMICSRRYKDMEDMWEERK